MENLNQFMNNNKLDKNEETRLDKIVLQKIKPEKSPGLGIFYKFALTLFVIFVVGIGVFFLPEEQQRKVVKPVSAMEVIQKTQQTLKEMLAKPGILHYSYNIKTVTDFEEYDNFDVEGYVSNQDEKYLIRYDVSKSDTLLPTEMVPGKSYRDFSPQKFATFSDGINEYSYSYGSTSNWRNLSEEMISIEHRSQLKSLVGFYDYLLQGESSQYKLKEDKINNREVFVITFTYPGIALTREANGATKRVETIYEAVITIDKETYLPISNESSSTFSSLQDSQIETYNEFEIISIDEANNIFEFSQYIDQLVPINKNTSPSSSIINLGNGKFELRNPGEDIITPIFSTENKEYILDGNFLFDKITRKPTIIGKFLLGKELEVSGFTQKTEVAEVLWIQDINYFRLKSLNPTIPVQPTDTNVMPTPTHRLTIPTENSYSGIVYDSEYGGSRREAIIVEGTLPEGLQNENNSNIERASIKIESEDMVFSINEWYENGFSYSNWIPEEIDTEYLGNILMHEYAAKFIYYFTDSRNYKKSDCKDFLGNPIQSPCVDTSYKFETAEGPRFLTISCEVKTTPEKATKTCKEIINNLSIAK
ncbi:MAG TPA: hypothetical protein PKU78_00790 [Candidatus Dojkabacteria bacterium]|nr:hypothetical protein [Candidatus Dojkabacteria bacterium]